MVDRSGRDHGHVNGPVDGSLLGIDRRAGHGRRRCDRAPRQAGVMLLSFGNLKVRARDYVAWAAADTSPLDGILSNGRTLFRPGPILKLSQIDNLCREE
jgi:hypothetical protein